VKPVAKRIRRTPADAREAILAVARERLLQHGLDGLKIADVAQQAGMSHATLIHHFGSSDGMRRALVERMANELLGEFLAVLESHPHSAERRGEMLGKLFDTLANDRHAQLFAWLALEAGDTASPFDDATQALLENGQPAPDRRNARFGVTLAVTSAIGLGIAAPWLVRTGLMAKDTDRRRFAAWLSELLGAGAADRSR